MEMKLSARLDEDRSQAGFFCVSLTVISICALQLGVFPAPTDANANYVGLALPIAVALILLSGFKKGFDRSLVLAAVAVFTTALVVASWVAVNPNQALPGAAAMTLLLSLSVLLFFAFRVAVSLYLALSVSIAFVVLLATSEVGYTALVFILTVCVFSVMNYGARLLLDHESELVGIAKLKARFRLQTVSATLYLMLPAFVLVVGGMLFHYQLQIMLLKAAYGQGPLATSAVSMVDASCGASPISREQLHSDFDCTIRRFRDERSAEVQKYHEELATRALDALSSAPGQASEALAALAPPTISSHAACEGFRYRNRFVSFSFRSPCRELIDTVNEALTRNHARFSQRASSAIAGQSEKVASEIQDGRAESLIASMQALSLSIDSMLAASNAVFALAFYLEVASYLVVLVSLIAALQMILGRVVFDASGKWFGGRALCFQLSPGTAHPIGQYSDGRIQLPSSGRKTTYWYASLSVTRSGIGTRMQLRLPQLLSGTIQRLLAGNLLLTRIVVGPHPTPAVGGRAAVQPATLSANVPHLVLVEIGREQSVCFRLADLVAFSEPVRLRTKYSTHVGGNLLRVPSFYAVADGPGWVVLRSDGKATSLARQGDEVLACNVLAWDERQAFSLRQDLTMPGVWLNEPSLVVASSSSLIVEDGRMPKYPVLQRVCNLLRYFLLPF